MIIIFVFFRLDGKVFLCSFAIYRLASNHGFVLQIPPLDSNNIYMYIYVYKLVPDFVTNFFRSRFGPYKMSTYATSDVTQLDLSNL